ncbi:membrane protein insertion efficiency factor YidD [Colwelliaceae bacterium MEBiC 14330]
MIKGIILNVIRYYQKTGGSEKHFAISCNFTPSCSEYTYQAIEQFGVVKGIALGFQRIRRCNDRDCLSVSEDPLPKKVTPK